MLESNNEVLQKTQVLNNQQVQVKANILQENYQKNFMQDGNIHSENMERFTLLSQYGKLPDTFRLSEYKKEFNRMDLLLNSKSLKILSKNLEGSLFRGGNSPEMAAVKENLKTLTNRINKKFDMAEPDWEVKYREHVKAIEDAYVKTISAANIYIKLRNPNTTKGKDRLNMVKNIKDILEGEQSVFLGMADEFVKQQNQILQGTTSTIHNYTDILFMVRAQEINGKSVGRGSTDSVRKTELDGTTYFYKDEEKIVDTKRFDKNKIRDDIVKTREYPEDFVKSQDYATLKEIHEKLSKCYPGYLDDIEIIKDASLAKYLELLSGAYREGSIKARKALPMTKAEFINLAARLGDINFENLKTFRNLQNQVDSVYQASCLANTNRIAPGSDLSLRNVATSRLAEFAGMENLFAKSKTTIRQNERGNLIRGNLMEAARGVSSSDLKDIIHRNKTKHIYMTSKAAEMMSNMSIMDFITGQQDRHIGNIMFEYRIDKDSLYITGVQGIDNDMSFSKLTGKDLMFGRNRLGGLMSKKNGKSIVGVQHVTKEMYAAVLKMHKYFGAVKMKLLDCGLSEKEIEALEDRITTTLHYIYNCSKMNKNFVLKNYDQIKSTDKISNPLNVNKELGPTLRCELFSIVSFGILNKPGMEIKD